MCVVLTLVNVAGFMHFWGLTIDTVSACYLIISIGNDDNYYLGLLLLLVLFFACNIIIKIKLFIKGFVINIVNVIYLITEDILPMLLTHMTIYLP